MKIVISSGHGKYIRGARGNPVPPQLDEVDEARRVVDAVADNLRALGEEVITYHDDVSETQSENLERIVDFHNAQGSHDYDVSVHFNAYDHSAFGTECCYLTQETLAEEMAYSISEAGEFKNRGPKYRDDLYFLHNTIEKSILLEVCFCDNTDDSNKYNEHFDQITLAIAHVLSDKDVAQMPEKPEKPAERPPAAEFGPLLTVEGKVSYFGGPEDMGVSSDEGLAFFYEYDDAPHLFLDEQPPGTSGLARRLNPDRPYVACRWDYDVTPKEMLRQPYPALVRSEDSGREALAWPADWGPHESTNRVADISPGLMEKLGIETDDIVEVIYPAPIIREFVS